MRRLSLPHFGLFGFALGALLVTTPPAEGQVTLAEPEYTGDDRIEQWRGKRVLVVTPHPDDETFTSGGTLALLAARGNDVRIVIYTTDNAGSRDPQMTHERLAAIRRAEEEDACRILGIASESIVWLGHDDGMLEYVDRRELTRQVAAEIRRFRPDAVLSVDPGAPFEQYHKSDHRSAAFITVDAIRAARWRLYFPELEQAGLEAWNVPLVFFYYSAQPNYTVDITAVAEQKARAAAAHTSQFDPQVDRYDPASITEEHLAKLAATLLARAPREEGRVVERFRRSTAY
ncbi:MAG TPA: PIG-L deacetylase family protein [Thermoanaerobaculia bacterium]|nr:PIG-L deacetylase family protein [Thermoanaerobaculia bacterium]